MNELLDAIKSTLLNSALYNDVGGRCYLDIADSPDYPNVIYQVVTCTPDKTFTEHYYDIIIQFSLRCPQSSGTTILNTMYTDLVALFDDKLMTVTSHTLVWMREQNCVTMTEQVDPLPDGSMILFHRAVDFEYRISKN